MEKFIIDQVCKSCGGTGLYSGMGEGLGIAVVCSTCKGTGCQHFEYEYTVFVKRTMKKDIKRVIQHNPGVCVGAGNGFKLEDFGGMTYDQWAAGEQFPEGVEMRRFTCPAWWYQGVDYKRKPGWKECIGIGTFSSCREYLTKERCWARFDQEGK